MHMEAEEQEAVPAEEAEAHGNSVFAEPSCCLQESRGWVTYPTKNNFTLLTKGTPSRILNIVLQRTTIPYKRKGSEQKEYMLEI